MNNVTKKILILLLLCFFSTNLFAVSETQIKAVFLEKFTHLIEWPEETNTSFVVCVLNDESFADALEEIYKVKTFKNRQVSIINIDKKEEIKECQLLFIGKETSHINKVLAHIEGKPILTVSDDKENVPEDVMITMFLNKNRFKYIINNKAAQDVNVKISHLLLRSAQEVIK